MGFLLVSKLDGPFSLATMALSADSRHFDLIEEKLLMRCPGIRKRDLNEDSIVIASQSWLIVFQPN